MPGSPPHVIGFAALRGEVLVLVDVRGPLGLSVRGLWEPRQMVVVSFDGERTGIAVDQVLELARAPVMPVDALPLPLRQAGAHGLRGALRRGTAGADRRRDGTAAMGWPGGRPGGLAATMSTN